MKVSCLGQIKQGNCALERHNIVPYKNERHHVSKFQHKILFKLYEISRQTLGVYKIN